MERKKKEKEKSRICQKQKTRAKKRHPYEIWVCVITFLYDSSLLCSIFNFFFVLFASNQTQNGNFILHFPPLLRKIDQKFEFFVSTFWVSSHSASSLLSLSSNEEEKHNNDLKICGKGIRNVSRCFWMSIKRHKWDKNKKKIFFSSFLSLFLFASLKLMNDLNVPLTFHESF